MDIDIFPREIKRRAIGAGVMVCGIMLIGLFTNWSAAAGVFLLVTGNNIERSSRQ